MYEMNVNGFSREVGFQQACKEAGLRLFGQKEEHSKLWGRVLDTLAEQ